MSTGFGRGVEDIPAESYDQKVSWKHCQQVFLLPSVEVLWEQMKTVTILEKKKGLIFSSSLSLSHMCS